MYYPKHQIKKLTGADIPKLLDQAGNAVKALQVLQTGDGNFFEFNQQAIDTGNFNNVTRFFAQPEQTPQVVDNVLQSRDIDYSKPTVKRYFLYNRSNNKTKELTRKTYLSKKQNKRPYEVLEVLEWRIKGPIKDVYIQNRLYQGAETHNKAAVEELKAKIPTIQSKITDYTKFVQQVQTNGIPAQDYKTSTDQFYIPGPSKEL